MQHVDAAIAGAGIIGLATALELASAGLRVVVFERQQAMHECSWAAAGMLAAADPETPSALRELSAFSVRLYPEFLAKIEHLSGRKIPIRTTRTLQGSRTPPAGIEVLGPGAVHAIVPGLQPGSLNFFLLEEQSLDPRDLVRALPEAAKALGVTLIEKNNVDAVRTETEPLLIETRQGKWRARNFINACGAWAADLSGLPISPRKGQILLVESPERLTVTLRTPDVYIVPRGGGQYVIGATVENSGYDKRLDSASISRLHKAAAELWPPIREAVTLDSWAGLRPATADFLPIIGPSDAIDGERGTRDSENIAHCWLALGHFRNGIMLAPGTARLLRQMILRQPVSINCTAFTASRFAESLAR